LATTPTASVAPAGPLRVAMLGPANSIHLQRWAQAIAARGHALCVISQHRCEPALLPASATLVWLPHGGTAGYLLNLPRLRRALRHWRPDLLHAHYASGYGSSAMLAGFVPTLLSVWGSDVGEFPQRGALQAALLRHNLRRATALAATSRALAQQVQRLVPERRDIAVTPFGVDLQRFCPRAGAAPQPGLTVGIVKTLAPTYGIDLLLRAFAGLLADDQLRNALPALRLLVVGDGPQRGELQALAAALGLGAQQLHFAGAVAHAAVPHWLQQMDLFVAPSRAESFGVAVIEAGACGLPVVVSDAGGLPEVVRDGETGLVVPCGDVAALQAAMKRLLLDAALRARMGRAAREHVAREYAWEACVERMLACYLALPRTA
jgi:glycosyltransferase involved in cell wall biosynthesis